ncbi:MAG: SDR family NAD(P)-dependent oxidoreductase [Planctomycetota bacterium]|nr:SDR family NAD(P)-dependent oxidoreductase [Planctomycetota bacterium]
MTGELEGKVAIVTGGGWNIGRAIALRFARAGARVAIAGRNEERLRETAAALEDAVRATHQNRHEVLCCVCDVTDLEAVEALVARTVETFGTLDVVAAIAGGGGGYEAIDAIDPAWWAEVVSLNLVGTFHTARAALPALRAKRSGSILTCTGGGAFFPIMSVPATAYASAKAGICRFTDQLAVELLDDGVRVNCLSPELTWSPDELARVEEEERRTGTPHQDRARNHSPEESAELALWLVSDASAPLTGRTVSVNDTWWRDPEQVAAVAGDLHAYTLRRVDATGSVPR